MSSKSAKKEKRQKVSIQFEFAEAEELSEEELQEVASIIAKWIIDHERKQKQSLKPAA